MPRLLWWFALCNFVLGTGAFGLSGYLAPLAQDLDISIGMAGQTMTAYALSNALLAPLAMVWTRHWPRRRLMLVALGLYSAGALLCTLAPSFWTLMVGRVLMGLGAVFTPVAAGVAVGLVAAAQRGRALSRTFLGMSLSYVLGMPLGAWVGLALGWRWPLAVVALLALAMALFMSRQLDANVGGEAPAQLPLRQLLGQGDVAITLAFTLLYFTAIFTVSAYMGPVQMALNPLTATGLSVVLMCIGLAGVAGTLLGGWGSDRLGPRRTLRWLAALMTVMMLVLPWTQGWLLATVLVCGLWSLCGFGMMTPQQARLAEQSFSQAPMLMSLNASMVYIGTALGAAVGGWAIPQVGFAQLAWVGAGFAALALASLGWRRRRSPAGHAH
jgi:predicted MFS family arabinose efflux permease